MIFQKKGIFSKNKGAIYSKIAPPLYFVLNSALKPKSMESQLSLEKKLMLYLFLLIFYVVLKLDTKFHFFMHFHHFWKSFAFFGLYQVLSASKQAINLLQFRFFSIKNCQESISRKYTIISIHFQQNRRYLILLQQKGAISIKNHRFLWNQSKNRTFLNKNKGAISKIAPIRPLKCGRRYLDIFNSAFLLLICLKSFENEIAPLKAHPRKT